MKNIKRVLAALLVAVMVLPLVACGTSGNAYDPSEAFDENNIVISFGMLSDTHITETATSYTNVTLPKAFSVLKEASGGLDAICVSGDLTEWGKSKQLEQFANILTENLDLEETPLISCSGNHDYFYQYYDKSKIADFGVRLAEYIGDSSFAYDVTDWTTAPRSCRHVVLNGIHFICLNVSNYVEPNDPYDEETVAWFETEMAAAAKESKDNPIIVLSHISIPGTIAGSNYSSSYYPLITWHSDQMREILEQYPQAIYFSGHTHYSNVGDNGIMQTGFTAIDVMPLTYMITDYGFYQNDEGLSCTPDDAYEYPGAMLVQIDKNGNTRIARYNASTGEQIRDYWYIGNASCTTQLYGVERSYVDGPTWSSETPLQYKVTENTDGTSYVVIYGDAAQTDNEVYFYRIDIYQVSNDGVKTHIECRDYQSDYYTKAQKEDLATKVSFDLGSIQAGNGGLYMVVTPYDIWGNSGVPISLTYSK